MREIASLELHLAVKELKEGIEGAYLKKFYEDEKDSFRFVFYKASKSITVHCMLLRTFNSTKYSPEPRAATQFAIATRKRVENAKVKRVYQYGSDRIIIMELVSKGTEYSIAIEMFGRGNLLLVKGNAIELCYKRILYRDREVRSRAPYIIEQGRMGIEEMESSAADLIAHACSEDDMLIRAVSRYMNIGPAYIDDALRSRHIDPRAKADSVEQDSVAMAIAYVFSRIASPEPVIYIDNGAYSDYSAYPLERYRGMERKGFGSMNELLDEFNKEGRRPSDANERKLAEIEASILKQKQLAQKFAKEEREYAEMGKRIMENMNAVNAVIGEIRQKKKPGIEELNRESEIKVEGIDLKRKRVSIDL